jgi:DNA-directed RNA polymerase specialized sigma24 family protein
MDDLLQDARVGLLLAVREWNPTRGRLAAWCARRAYQTVIDSVRRASRRQEELLADRLEADAEDGAEGGRPLAEILADPRQNPDEHFDRQPRLRLARAIARAAAEAGPWAEEALDRLVEAHEAGDEPAAERLRARLSQVVAAAMTAAIRDSSAAALRQRRRVA